MDLKPDFKPGDELLASTINALIEGQQSGSSFTVKGGARISVRQSGNGVQITGSRAGPLRPCTVTTALTTTTGMSAVGVVELYVLLPSTGALTDSAVALSQVNSYGAFPAGTKGFVVYDQDGWPWFLEGSAGGAYFCLPTTLGAATGSWPSLTPGSQAGLTVYQASGTSLTSLGTFTVYNWFPATPAASKVLMVFPDDDGNFVAGPQSCT